MEADLLPFPSFSLPCAVLHYLASSFCSRASVQERTRKAGNSLESCLNVWSKYPAKRRVLSKHFACSQVLQLGSRTERRFATDRLIQ